MKIAFLINNIYGIGGTNRTVINLATGLSRQHTVEIVSIFRRQETAKFDIPAEVALRPLVDLRPGGAGADRGDPLLAEPTEVVPPQEEFYSQYSRLSDQRIREYLEQTDADVVVGTRSSLNIFVARFGREDCVRIAQEHMTHLDIPEEVRAEMARVYPRLDAVTTVTEADARIFRATTPVPVPVLCVPNSVPRPALAPADPAAKLIVGAGRLDPIKRYDLLVRAFDRLSGEFPDWRLRIYGQGGERGALRALISELGATERILLMGSAAPLDPEWVKGSIAAVTSDAESFGMTVVEAMRCGLPVVSTDCPVGPREIIRHGEDGVLVPMGDIDGIAAGLRALMIDDALRARMAEAALYNARRFDPLAIAERYATLFEQAAAARGLRLGARAGKRHGTAEGSPQLARGTARAMTWARRFWTPGTLGKGSLALVSVATGAALRVTAAVAHLEQVGRLPLLHIDLPAEQEVGVRVLLREVGDKGNRKLITLAMEPGPSPLGPGSVRLSGWLGPEVQLAMYEGRWTVVLETAAGVRSRVQAGLRDTRALLTARAAALAAPERFRALDWLTSYPTKEGHLAIRSWRRARHAECTSVEVTPDGIVVQGTVFGEVRLAARPRLMLRRRGATGTELTFPGLASGSRFRVDLPADALALARLGRWEDWDCWLLPDWAEAAAPQAHRSGLDLETGLRAGLDQESAVMAADEEAEEDRGARPVRISRILDDFVDVKQVFEYPTVSITDSGVPGYAVVWPPARVDVRPYCTATGELSVQVVERD